ncbi:GPW/gp25 family protein [Mucilaginibacter sp. BJC16-A38]|uniref:GPW/gp25 family protein n=1 Tax=Mucilaginibacter phenanthrenivorans TaxID=1234842 RepID=UPI00215721C5|nr:GPW/gp25 family protein [Mucilaginibacter phenanthrenivorans]MCR8557645.1 GPW/gp25 family protein [Mucilaginibacter phenanthrenivorans]MDP9075935.1 GPW/gp25 family protein [Bacteroidota bacterium]
MANSFLGTGWSFPPTFDNFSNNLVMTSDEADIQLSLQILLATRKGERIMLPDYGCNLDEMLFEPITTTFKTYISEMIRTAILFYESRIDLNSVKIDDSRETEGVIAIVLDYTVRTTNSRFNFVYPFYKNEGTEIQ